MIRTSLPENHFRLIKANASRIAKKFPNLVNDSRELYYVGYMALQKAVADHDASRGAKLETYASRCIYYAMLKELRHINCMYKPADEEQYIYRFVELDNTNSNDYLHWEEQESESLEHAFGEALDAELEQLAQCDRELIDSYFGLNGERKTLKQLGEARGVSLQAVHKRVNRVVGEIRDDLYCLCA